MDNLYRSMTSNLSGGKTPDDALFRRFREFQMDAAACGPVVQTDFMLTISSLTNHEEIEAARGAKGDSVMLAYSMAKSSIYAVNGKRVGRGTGHLDVLWEAIGPQGRNIVVGQWSELSSASEEALGKANRTMRVF